MKNKGNVLFGLVMIAFTSMASAQDKAKQIDELMRRYVDNGQFNGTVLVTENGKVIFKKGYGLANMEWNIPNTPDTKFRLGSLTKQFTAMLIMQLVEQGKLKLEGKITDYLTDYPKAAGDKITLHHLLTHTSGIPNYTNFPAFKRLTAIDTNLLTSLNSFQTCHLNLNQVLLLPTVIQVIFCWELLLRKLPVKPMKKFYRKTFLRHYR